MFEPDRTMRLLAKLMAQVNLEESGQPHEWPGSLSVQTVDADGIAYQVTDGAAGLTVTVFEARDEAPAAYPHGFPFVPRVRVALAAARAPMLSWMDVDQVEQLTDELVEQSVDHGWTLGAVAEIPSAGGGRMARLEKRGARRCIMGMRSIRAVNLADIPATVDDARREARMIA